MTAPALELQGIEGTRGEVTLFRDVSLSLASGQLAVLEGPNGSGKTTLLRIVAGLTHATAGNVRWSAADGLDFANATLWQSHYPQLKEDFTAAENLLSLAELGGESFALDAARDALRQCGLGQRQRLAARRLSQGQRRRILLARLCLTQKCLWLLDEPQTALDREANALFESLLRKHLQNGGMAMVASHLPMAVAATHTIRFDGSAT